MTSGIRTRIRHLEAKALRLLARIKHLMVKAYCILPCSGVRFEKVEKKIYAVEGLLVPGQERWLFEAAKALPDGATIVEIGGYKGRSTCCFAFACVGTCKHIFTIDTFSGNETDFTGENRRNFFKVWRNNIKSNGLLKYVTPLIGFSNEVANTWSGPIHLLFIDGSHQYEDVLADFNNFYPYVVPGGIIALHDVEPGHLGPLGVWNEHAEGRLTDIGACSTLAFGRKPMEQKGLSMVESMPHIAARSSPRPSADRMGRLRILTDYLTGHRTRILMYHNISDDALDLWAVSPQKFAAQMNWLKTHGYSVLSLSQALMDFHSGTIRRKSIVLTFDDGFVDFLENAVPVLSRYEYPATLFIVAGEVGGISRWRSPELQRHLLSWEEIREIAKMGYEIGSHGLHHRDLTTLCSEDLETEISISKELIEDCIGAPVNAFSYPWGAYDVRETDGVQKAGYHCAVTVDSKWENGPETDHFRLQRKTMCRTDSLADFARKVGGHNELYRALRDYIKILRANNLPFALKEVIKPLTEIQTNVRN